LKNQKQPLFLQMQNETYGIGISADATQYEFLSVGSNGTIHKIVTFTEANYKGFYDLSLTDYDSERKITIKI
jgi:hypothetical protein